MSKDNKNHKPVISDIRKLEAALDDAGEGGSLATAFYQALTWTLLNIIDMHFSNKHFRRKAYSQLLEDWRSGKGKRRDNAEAKFSDWMHIGRTLLRHLSGTNVVVDGRQCSIVNLLCYSPLTELLRSSYGLVHTGKKDVKYAKTKKKFSRKSFWLLENIEHMPSAQSFRKTMCPRAKMLVEKHAFPWCIKHFEECKRRRAEAVKASEAAKAKKAVDDKERERTAQT